VRFRPVAGLQTVVGLEPPSTLIGTAAPLLENFSGGLPCPSRDRNWVIPRAGTEEGVGLTEQVSEKTVAGETSDPAQTALGGLFWRLFAATGCSSLGDGLVLVAFPLLAITLTHDPLLISGVAVAARLPAFAVGLPAGALADRVHRRRLAVTVEWARLAVLAAFSALLLLHADRLAVLYLVVFLLGSLEELFVAATFASLPAMVASTDLDRANGLLSFADLTAEEVAGQGLGGVLVALGSSIPFVIDALTFAASAVLLRRALPDLPAEPADASFRSDIVTGLRWFRSHPAVSLCALLVSSFAFCQSLVIAVLVLYLRVDLHLSATGYGLLLAVSAVGNVVGALFSARIAGRIGALWSIVAAGLVASGAYVLLGLAHSVTGAGIAMALECLGITVGNVASMSLRQRLIPAGLLGRVGTTFRMVIFAGMPVGALLGGLLAHLSSLRVTFLTGGIAQLVFLAVLVPPLWRRMRAGPPVAIDLTGDAI
jgi:MFS family permease